MKQKNPITPTCPRQRFPTSSVDKTRAEVPMVARANPVMNRRKEYTHILVEKAVRKVDKDMMRHERKSMFLRPSEVSASVARVSPPIKQPMKKAEAGSPVMSDDEHSRPHSEMMEVCLALSQAHAF